jgi:hypothetical protein
MSDDLTLQTQARALAPYLRPWILKSFYATGTYTPTYQGGTTGGTTTYTFQDAAWTRIGNVIVVRGQVAWSAATGTGTARISLPIVANGGNFAGACVLNGVTFANSAPEVQITAGDLFFILRSPLTNAAPTDVAIEAAGNVIWTLTYFVG